MKPLQFIAISCIVTSLSGCVVAVNTDDWKDEAWFIRQNSNLEKIELLALGITENSVRGDLGDPDFTESFVRDGVTFKILRYRTWHTDHDGTTTRDETTPLVFVEGKLVGWGDSAVVHATAN